MAYEESPERFTWKKLRDGSWGVIGPWDCGEGPVKKWDIIGVTKKNGEIQDRIIKRVVWHDAKKNVAIYEVFQGDATELRAKWDAKSAARLAEMDVCDECERRTPNTHRVTDMSGIPGNVCDYCYNCGGPYSFA